MGANFAKVLLAAGIVAALSVAGLQAAYAAAPGCLGGSVSVAPGEFVDIAPACTDPDGDALSYAIVTQGTQGTASVVAGQLRYTANPTAAGDDAFSYTATDATGAVSAPATISVLARFATCGSPVRRIDRTLQVWYGSAFEGATRLRDGTELSDHIVADLQGAIGNDASVDARGRDVAAFTTLPQSGIEWAIGAAESLPAEANLRAALAAGLVSPVFDAVADRGTTSYLLGSFESVETAPVLVGDSDAPIVCGQDGDSVTIAEEFVAEVSFFELNARGAPAPANRAPVCARLSLDVVAGGSVEVAPACTDEDGDALSYAIGTQGTKGTASVVNGQLRYVANASSSGGDSFTYTASDGKGGTSPPATVAITITAAAVKPSLTVKPGEVREGTGPGSTQLVFQLRLSTPAPAGGASVRVTTRGRTATSGADFVALDRRIVYAAGEQTKTVAVTIVRDALKERNETFTLVLTDPIGVDLADASAVGTIIDDDRRFEDDHDDDGDVDDDDGDHHDHDIDCGGRPHVRFARGDDDTREFRVVLDQPAGAKGRTIAYRIRVADSDNADMSGEIVFAKGQSSQRVRVRVGSNRRNDDDLVFEIVNAKAGEHIGITARR